MTQPSSKKLADALAAEPCAPEHEARRKQMVAGALRDHYHDYFGHSATPCVDLNRDCEAIGLKALAARVRDGEFDATKEESDAWVKSDEGQKALASLVHPGSQTLGDAPIGSNLIEQMNVLGRVVDAALNGDGHGTLPGLPSARPKPKRNGFILMVFPFDNHEGRCNYISNARREDVVVMLKEQIKRFEGQPEVSGRA